MLPPIPYTLTEYGRGPTPLLLLHGFTGCGANWAAVGDVLGDTHRLLCPDLLGHGRTAAPPDPARYAMPHATADLIALLDGLGLDKVWLGGYSMGGRLALYMALHAPARVAGLVLESSSPGLATAAERATRLVSDEALAQRIEQEGIPAFVAAWEQLPLWASQAQFPAPRRQALREQRLRNHPQGLANSLRGMGTGAQPNLWPRLRELTMPVVLLAGALDEKFVAINQRMAAEIPSAVLHLIPGCGHAVHWEAPQVWGVGGVGGGISNW